MQVIKSLKNIEHLKPELLPLLYDEEYEDFILDLPIFCEIHPYIKLKNDPDGFCNCPICKNGLYTSEVTRHFKLFSQGDFA